MVAVSSHHAFSTDVSDALDRSSHPTFAGTHTTTRIDGHGREIEQILRQRQPGGGPIEYYRLQSSYRADGQVVLIARAQTATADPLPPFVPGGDAPGVVAHRVLFRSFVFDSVGRRIGTSDPDTNSPTNLAPDSRTWRYLFNRVGDLAAVRDPRGCGQNFYYDHGGRLLGEDYVSCGEAQPAGDTPDVDLPGSAIGTDQDQGGRSVDVRYYFDALPPWKSDFPAPDGGDHYRGRLTATSDRGQRSLVGYDARGQAVWGARQMVMMPDPGAAAATLRDTHVTDLMAGRISGPTEEAPRLAGTRQYDTVHTYVVTTTFDHQGRPTRMRLPRDPDFVVRDSREGRTMSDAARQGPSIEGRMIYYRRDLPWKTRVKIDGRQYEISETRYNASRLPWLTVYGAPNGTEGGPGDYVARQYTSYDARLRPTRIRAWRTPTEASDDTHPLGAVKRMYYTKYRWDAADNLTEVLDNRLPSDWPAGYRPRRQRIAHDALYRVANVAFDYAHVDPEATTDDEEERRLWGDGRRHRLARGARLSPLCRPRAASPRPDALESAGDAGQRPHVPLRLARQHDRVVGRPGELLRAEPRRDHQRRRPSGRARGPERARPSPERALLREHHPGRDRGRRLGARQHPAPGARPRRLALRALR